MKAMWFLPFTFAAGAEGFALFVPYLLAVSVFLYLARAHRALPKLQLIEIASADLELVPN